MQKKIFTPLTRFARSERSERRSATLPTPVVASLPSGFALRARILSRFAPSGFALRAHYLPYDTPRVPRSVHANFMTIGSKLWALEGYIHSHIDSP